VCLDHNEVEERCFAEKFDLPMIHDCFFLGAIPRVQATRDPLSLTYSLT
jgi:hypothetical protein